MVDYIQSLFEKPKEIYTARNMKAGHYFLFILLMSVLLTFLSIFTVKPEIDKISKDYTKINSFLPTFELVNGELTSETDSFVYQTDTIVFYFDPEDKITTDLIDKNMVVQKAPISIGLMNQEIYINFSNFYQKINYAELGLATGDTINITKSIQMYKPILYSLLLILLLLFNLLFYLTQLFSISIFANLISAIERTGLSFFQNAKITLLASLVPFLLIATINALQIPITYQYEIISIASLSLFYLSIKEFKKRLKKQNTRK